MPDSRRPWSQKQDDAIRSLVKKYGVKRWADVSSQMQSKYKIYCRTGKQCRQRWHNHLNPEINKSPWTAEQQQIIFQSHHKYGNQWTQIAKLLEGRTDNSIKNYFYSTLRKALRKVNKILGSKNSTAVIKAIQPAILSQIFYYSGLQQQEITYENKTLVQNCKELTQLLMEFSSKSTEQSMKMDRKALNKEQQIKIDYLIERLVKFNEQHENIKTHKNNSTIRRKDNSQSNDVQLKPEENSVNQKYQKTRRQKQKINQIKQDLSGEAKLFKNKSQISNYQSNDRKNHVNLFYAQKTGRKSHQTSHSNKNRIFHSFDHSKKESMTELKKIESILPNNNSIDQSLNFLDIPQMLPRLRSESSKLSSARDLDKSKSSNRQFQLNKKQSQLSQMINSHNFNINPNDFNTENLPFLDGQDFTANHSPSFANFFMRTPKYPTPGTYPFLPQLNLRKNSSGNVNASSTEKHKNSEEMDRLLFSIKNQIDSKSIKKK